MANVRSTDLKGIYAQLTNAAGKKRYGLGAAGRPTVGPVDPLGYAERAANAVNAKKRAYQAAKKGV